MGEAEQSGLDGVGRTQRDRQNWAVHMYECWLGRHFQETGRLEEANAILDGRLRPADADRIVSILDAASIVAVGRVKLHRGDDTAARELAEVAKVIVASPLPSVQRHTAWYLALHAAPCRRPLQRGWARG